MFPLFVIDAALGLFSLFIVMYFSQYPNIYIIFMAKSKEKSGQTVQPRSEEVNVERGGESEDLFSLHI